ncbi:MAG: Abi family protein [Clostridiales bacterium]|nr:Abi family protein [Clostridiales bacterium]
MKQLKQHQPPMTVDEQIKNLKELGLIIEDEKYAKDILNDISYFRLIKAYCLRLKKKNGCFDPGVTFEHIVGLYLFNANFRQLLYPLIEKIEINARCRIANYFSEQYDVLGYKESNNFADEGYHKQFLEDIKDEIRRNAKAPFVKNFQNNYEGGDLPLYALVEICSFGMLSKFFKNMKNPDKKAVAKTFGVGYTYYESWIESISYVRNICAHYGRLYNAKLAKRPILYKQYTKQGISNDRIYAVLLCMRQLLNDDLHWNRFLDDLEALVSKYSDIELGLLGFPKDWKTELSTIKM